MSIMIALAALAAMVMQTQTVAPQTVLAVRRHQAWALGFSGFVSHVCPAWEQRTDVFRDDVLPSAETWNGPWAQDGPLAVAHLEGLRAAERGQRADPAFCDHPTRGQPKRANQLEKVLIRRVRGR